MARQYPCKTEQAHKRHDHLGWTIAVVGISNIVNRAGGKAERKKRPEAHRLLGRYGTASDRQSRGIEALQDAHRLKKIEPISLFEQYVF
jgi:hypothetical protein